MNTVFLSLGSSLGNRELYIKKALYLINRQIGKIIKTSHLYQTEPWGFEDKNLFLNQVIQIETGYSPIKILEKIHKIELKLERVKNSLNYEARTIDIDILFFNYQIYNSEKLQIPHKHLHNRKFVLVPLNEIAPYFTHPVIKKYTCQLLQICEDNLMITKFSKISEFEQI